MPPAIDEIVSHHTGSERYEIASQIVAEARRRFRASQAAPPVKRCPSCDTVKSVDDFGADASRPGGRAVYCLECRRAPAPHSRACGIRPHDHGSWCSTNCPTCHGRAPVTDARTPLL